MTQLDQVEMQRLVKLYDLECYLFGEVSSRFKERQTLTPYDFFAIIVWKSNRAKTKIKQGLADCGKTVEGLMWEVSQAETPECKVEILDEIPGIGLPMASAILTVCYPDTFTVLDERAWEVLQRDLAEDLPNHYPQNISEYLQYCDVCRHRADQQKLSLRDFDRFLWAKSWEDDLYKLIKGL